MSLRYDALAIVRFWDLGMLGKDYDFYIILALEAVKPQFGERLPPM